MKKIMYIVSDVNKSLAFEWVALHLKTRYDLIFVLIGEETTSLKNYLSRIEIRTVVISDVRFPGTFRKWMHLIGVIRKEKPDIIHTHLWRANLLGLSAGWLLSVKQRTFTRHHATIHYDQFPSGRKWDLLCNFLATDIVAISDNIRKVLVERDKADPAKIRLIHHGFDFKYFQNISPERITVLRKKYHLSEEISPVVGVISRFVEWKGIQIIIPAFERLLQKYPYAKLVLANASGDYEQQLQLMLDRLPVDSYVKIKFEEDLAALYCLFDVFLHTPIDRYSEAFGQTYVEALASGVPSVFTLSGVAPEFIVHENNALVVDFKDSDQIEKGILHLLEDHNLNLQLRKNGIDSVQSGFDIHLMIGRLTEMYGV